MKRVERGRKRAAGVPLRPFAGKNHSSLTVASNRARPVSIESKNHTEKMGSGSGSFSKIVRIVRSYGKSEKPPGRIICRKPLLGVTVVFVAG